MLTLIVFCAILKMYYSLIVEHNEIGVIEHNHDANRGDTTEQQNLLRRRLIPGGFTNDDKLEILNIHNRLRNLTAQGLTYGQPSASDMNQLVWDAGLAQVAQDYSAKCTWAHNSNRVKDLLNYLDITSFDYTNQEVGENLFFSSGSESLDVLLKGIQYWYEEYTYYTYAKISSAGSCASGQQCGHYTQVVWSATRYVGCGYTKCSNTDGLGASGVLLVCNYYFAGNIVGYYPYQSGSGATQCPADRTPQNNVCGGCPNSAWDKYCCQFCSSTTCLQAQVSNLLAEPSTCTNGLGISMSSGQSLTASPTTSTTTTAAPTTAAPTTAAPTTAAPTTAAPTTAPPTTAAPTTPPTTILPTTAAPTTAPPTTAAPTTTSTTISLTSALSITAPPTAILTTSSSTTSTASPTTTTVLPTATTASSTTTTSSAARSANALSSGAKKCCKSLNGRYASFCSSILSSATCGTYSNLCAWNTC
jgi:hypothetical protein